jgi:hypothetical protein
LGLALLVFVAADGAGSDERVVDYSTAMLIAIGQAQNYPEQKSPQLVEDFEL